MKKFLTLAAIATIFSTSSFACDKDEKRPPNPEKMAEKMLEKIDTDGDKTINEKEWKKESERRFKELDANNDGKITQDEFKSFHEKMREKFKENKDQKPQE